MNRGLRLLRWTLKLYPRTWRERYGDELVTTWLDQYESEVASGRFSHASRQKT